ncbi:DPP IV N-terminal domain-containing protein [Streptomyces sp. NPDC060205]|uniref:S9 family peptidase n=1 Tax=Streptomyces sp. NPDC060205 TaxID=3347072 RepID=UPI003657BE09
MAIDWQSRYAVIQKLLGDQSDLVINGEVHPRWIGESSCFWYVRQAPDGREVKVVDARTKEVRTLELGPVWAALEAALETSIDAVHADLGSLDLALGPLRATFEFHGRRWEYLPEKDRLRDCGGGTGASSLHAPDGKTAAFVRDHDLWVRDLTSDDDRQLTNDGEELNAYASPPLAYRASARMRGEAAQGLWSPDSRYFLTLQTDERHVPELPWVDFVPEPGARPAVHPQRTSLPGDSRVTEFRMLALDVSTGRQIEARYPRLSAVRMNDTVFANGLAWWSRDGRTAYFVDIERGEMCAHVVAFDPATGTTEVVFSETSDTSLELGVNVYARTLVTAVPGTDELIWYSERSGRGHLYLYDLTTGALKNAITSGEWQVREVVGVDVERRELHLLAGGITSDEDDPYLRRPCVVSLDGGDVRVLSDEPGDHTVWSPGDFGLVTLHMMSGIDSSRVSGFSPDCRYFVETVSHPGRLPHTVLRNRNGEAVLELEKAQNVGLPEDWEWPEPVTLKAADGETDIFGLLFKPADYDPAQSYPVIDHIYGGPQIQHTPKAPFTDYRETATFLETAAFTRLGAFALILDGRGTAFRERSFRQASYRAAQSASDIDDHIAGIRQLAERYPAMDLSRVGITGFSGGGYATALAVLRRGDFFNVAVAGGGNYDQTLFWHGWGERYHGAFDIEHYRTQAARTYADGLAGKLMLIHGLRDAGCHPAGLFQFTQALIDAEKDFDLVVLPDAGHEMTGYAVRRRLDYFVTHLLGDTPPRGVKMASPFRELLRAKTAANAPGPTAGIRDPLD